MNSPAKYHSRTTSGSSMPSRTGGGESVSEGGSEATPLPAQDAQAWDQHDQLQQQKLRRRRGSLRKAAMFGRGAAQRDPRRLEQSALPPLQAPQPQIQPQTQSQPQLQPQPQPQIPKTTPSAVSAAAAAIPPPADDYAGIVSPGSPSTTTAAGLGISDITPRASMDDYASRAASAAAAAALLSPTAKAAAAAKFYVSPRSSTDGNEDATATTTTTTTTASGVRRHGRNRSSSGSISYLGKPDDDGPLLSPTRGGGGGGGSSSGTTSTTTAAATTTTTATGKSAAAAAAVAATTSLRAAHAAPQATAPLPKPAPRRLSQSSVSSSSLPTGPRIPERLPEQPERTSAAVHQPPPPTPARAPSSGQPHHAVRQSAGVPTVPTVPSQHARQQIHSLLQDQQVPPAAHAHHSYVRSHTHTHAHAHARSHLTMQPPPPKQRAKSPLALSDLASPLPSASASSSSATTTTNGVGVGVGVGVGGVTMTTAAAAAAAAADAGWDYAETAWWGWVMLIVTWVVFVTGMGSCLGVWSWAWDVGTTPYAPPELEDDPTLPIVGYYPALIILTSVMAWVWVVVAWIGMKYFKHAKISGD